jgi:hypothetical protein
LGRRVWGEKVKIVSGWNKILIKAKSSITYIEAEKALVSHTALVKTRFLWAKW